MKRLIVALIVAMALSTATVVPAFAHVHGITPLLQCSVDNINSGGLAVNLNDTPAAASNGGPIKGLIPRDVRNAPLTGGDGGFGKSNCP